MAQQPDPIATLNAAFAIRQLDNPETPAAIALLVARDEAQLAARVLAWSSQCAAARGHRSRLTAYEPKSDAWADPAPLDPLLERMQADADREVAYASERWQEVLVDVRAVQAAMLAETPGAAFADTGIA